MEQHETLRLGYSTVSVIVRLAVASLFVLCLIWGCSGKDTGHDVPPPGGTPKLHVPKTIQEKNGKT
jgi:hypothetical protein